MPPINDIDRPHSQSGVTKKNPFKKKIQQEKMPQKNKNQARHLSPEFMQIMKFGRTPRDENEDNVEGKIDGGNQEPQLFDIQNTLKRAMSKMLEESLDLTRKSSKQA